MTFSLPSATPEVLTGDVLKRDGAKWKVVLTASGIPVVDNWKMPRDWRDDIDAARYAPNFARASAAYRRHSAESVFRAQWS